MPYGPKEPADDLYDDDADLEYDDPEADDDLELEDDDDDDLELEDDDDDEADDDLDASAFAAGADDGLERRAVPRLDLEAPIGPDDIPGPQ